MHLPEVPACLPRSRGSFSKFIGVKVLSIMGWRFEGKIPAHNKMILAVAPHTSNWDFVIGISVILALNLKVMFMAKASIFIWPFGSLLKSLGGKPIYRKKNYGVVNQMVDEFNRNEKMILGLAPEGTRSKTLEWKSGFLHIASQANVPVVPISLDFQKKAITFHPSIIVKEEISSELAKIKQLYINVCAKNPQAV